ncbi:MAG: hypothetical protein DMG26_17035 [Acidobacteria bacterium]|nr:MAG: hypothetical protein DMG26_17035 [Acidobacteriota bacterium]
MQGRKRDDMTKNFADLPVAAQVATIAALPGLLALAAYRFWASPLSERVGTLEAQVKSIHQQNLANHAFEQQRAQYLSRIAQARVQLDTARSTIPDDEDADLLIALINDTAVSTGIHIRSFAAEPLMTRDSYTEAPFKLRIDGTYYALVEFFGRLAHAERLVGVTDLALGLPAHSGPGAYTVSPAETVGANCVLTTYFNRSAAPRESKVGH